MLRATAIVVLCLIASNANAFQVDCNLVRQYVAEHGRAKALAFAIKHGATWKQLREAKKCLSE